MDASWLVVRWRGGKAALMRCLLILKSMCGEPTGKCQEYEEHDGHRAADQHRSEPVTHANLQSFYRQVRQRTGERSGPESRFMPARVSRALWTDAFNMEVPRIPLHLRFVRLNCS